MANQNYYDQNLTLDEIVFEGRNKEYGAYDLRHIYPKMLTRSFLIGSAIFLLLALSPLIYTTIKNMTADEKVEVNSEMIDIQQDEIIEQPKEEEAPPPLPPKVEEPPKQEIIQNIVPEPVKQPKIEVVPPKISEQIKTTTGTINQEGERVSTYTPPPPPVTTPGRGTTVETKPAVDKNKIYEGGVQQSAEFSGGGLNGFRQKFQDNFDQTALEGEGTIKGEVTFVVELDGSISDIKCNSSNRDFNAEAIAAVKAIRQKWSPAKVNGESVRSRFRMPVTMNFE